MFKCFRTRISTVENYKVNCKCIINTFNLLNYLLNFQLWHYIKIKYTRYQLTR